MATNKALTLSIVIPVYNEEHHLKACLDSIAAQTEKPDEVIVVDNNSTDKTAEIAKSYPFVRLIHEPKQSVLYARNRGFNNAKGDIIGRLDGDSVLDGEWIKNIRRIFADGSVAAVTGPNYFYDMPFSPQNVSVDHLFKGPLAKYNKKFTFLAGNNMAIRKTAWDKVKNKICEDKTIHEDVDLAIHLRENSLKVAYDPALRAGISSRRYDDRPKQLRRYMSMTRQAFAKHDIRPVGAHVAEVAYWLGYFILWPLRRSYNPQTGRRSLQQFMHGNTPRKNPMD